MTAESPETLAARLELCDAWRGVGYAEAYRKLHPETASSAVFKAGGGYAIFVAPGSPVNSARGLGASGPVTAADLDAVEDFYASRGEAMRMHVCPLADESLIELARLRAYRLSMFFSVLALPIPPDFTPAALPDGMRVTRARPDQADLWMRVTAEGFEETASPSAEALEILGPNFHAPDSAPFMAWIDDEAGQPQPAGGGGLYLAPAVRALELGGASTRVAYRRRGVQRALIEARMAEGLRQGCDLAMVLTEPGSDSQRNLMRAGFSLAYTKVVLEKPAPGTK